MRKLGFDPGAVTLIGGVGALAEVTLQREQDGRLLLAGETDKGVEFSVLLRPDFLDEFVAQARAREQSAA